MFDGFSDHNSKADRQIIEKVISPLLTLQFNAQLTEQYLTYLIELSATAKLTQWDFGANLFSASFQYQTFHFLLNWLSIAKIVICRFALLGLKIDFSAMNYVQVIV